MKTAPMRTASMNNVSKSVQAAALAAVIALGTASYAASRAWAFNPQPDPPGISGQVGIADGQTARLNAVNATDVPVRVMLNFVNMDGSVVKRVEGTLLPGHGAFLDLSRAEVGDRGESRRGEIHGVVTVVSEAGRVVPPDPYRPSLEVFGADGRATVLDTNFHNPPAYHNPPGD